MLFNISRRWGANLAYLCQAFIPGLGQPGREPGLGWCFYSLAKSRFGVGVAKGRAAALLPAGRVAFQIAVISAVFALAAFNCVEAAGVCWVRRV